MPMPGATPPGLRAPGADRRGRRWQAAAWRAAARSPRRTSPGSRRSRGRGAARCQAGRGYARRRRQTPRVPPPARARGPATRSAPAARARRGAGLSQVFHLAHERGVILIGPTAASRPAWRARAPPPARRAPKPAATRRRVSTREAERGGGGGGARAVGARLAHGMRVQAKLRVERVEARGGGAARAAALDGRAHAGQVQAGLRRQLRVRVRARLVLLPRARLRAGGAAWVRGVEDVQPAARRPGPPRARLPAALTACVGPGRDCAAPVGALRQQGRTHPPALRLSPPGSALRASRKLAGRHKALAGPAAACVGGGHAPPRARRRRPARTRPGSPRTWRRRWPWPRRPCAPRARARRRPPPPRPRPRAAPRCAPPRAWRAAARSQGVKLADAQGLRTSDCRAHLNTSII